MNASLELLIGPMFAGKTSELIRRLTTFKKANCNVLYINSILDNRGDMFSTHNTSLAKYQDIDMVKTDNLMDILHMCTKVDVIAIDEGQFFSDLVEFYKIIVDLYKKRLIVSGLNGTSDRKPFGKLLDLIPFCDNIEFIQSFCTTCATSGKIVPAIFSKRISNTTGNICIGGSDSYIAVCREHYTS
jgi:thymidine kinase